MRPSWDEYFMRFAVLAAMRSTCTSRSVGAVIVRQNHIIATGYNGSPAGMAHCTEAGCLMEEGRCIRTLHAEQNAILQAALHGNSTTGATLYTTYRPCHVCARMVAGAGITRIVYQCGVIEGWVAEVLKSCHIVFERWERKTGND